MTQPILFAVEDGEHALVTEGAAIELPVRQDNTRRGAIVERLFEIAALERGYEIAANIGGGKDFDYIVRLPKGRPVVVQIKTGTFRVHKCCYDITNKTPAGTYSASAYDVLAVYLPDRSQWVFYSRRELGSRGRTTYTPRETRIISRKSRYGAYGETIADRDPDNWELLHNIAESLTLSGPTPLNVLPPSL
jgi:hypothetical protein